MLDKPQSEAVETILTDIYNEGRSAVLKAVKEFIMQESMKDQIAWCSDFLEWYKEHAKDYEMKFKVPHQ